MQASLHDLLLDSSHERRLPNPLLIFLQVKACDPTCGRCQRWLEECTVLMFSTRIKDAGIAIRHLRGRILFYTAGSGNGLERLGGKDVRTKFMKKESQIIQKGFATFQTRQKRRKVE